MLASAVPRNDVGIACFHQPFALLSSPNLGIAALPSATLNVSRLTPCLSNMDEFASRPQVPIAVEETADFRWLYGSDGVDSATPRWFSRGPVGADFKDMERSSSHAVSTGPNSSRDRISAPLEPVVLPNISVLSRNIQQVRVPNRHHQQHPLPRRRSKYLLRKSESQPGSITTSTFRSRHDGEQSLVMQRWQDSPPQNEGTSLSAIFNALDSPQEST